MKSSLNFSIGRVWFNAGWYANEALKFLKVGVGECAENSGGKVDEVALFELQIFKFILSFGIRLW